MLEKSTKIIKTVIFTASIIAISIIISYIVAAYSEYSLFLIPLFICAFLIIYLFTKNPFLGLLFVIFFLPFERIPSIDIGLVTLKINQFLGALLIVSHFLSLLFNKEKISPNALTWPLVFFLTIGFISIFSAEMPSRAITVFAFILFTVMLFFVTVNLVSSQERLKIVIKVLLWSSFLTSLFALFQFGGDALGLPSSLTGLKKGYGGEVLGFPRLQAFSQEPLYLANYLFIPLGLATGLFLEKVKFIKRGWLLILIILMLLVILLTVSRGAYIGLASFVLIFMLFSSRKVFTLRHLIIALIAIMIVAGTAIWAINKIGPKAYENFVGHIKLEDYTQGESIQARLKAWYDAYDAYKEKPWLGIGLGNFGPWVKGYPDPESVTGWDIVNNEYLEILAETGILGLISFVFFLLVLIIRSLIAYFQVKDDFLRASLVGLMAATAAILTQYCFFSTLYIIHIWILFGLFVAVQNLVLIKKTNWKTK